MSVLDWIRRQMSWGREHKRAWSSARIPGADGVSSFQRDCLAALARGCERAKQPVPDTRRVDNEEPHFTGQLRDGRTFFVYREGAEVGAVRLEEWDFLTPTELCEAFASAVAAPASGSVAV